MNHRTHWKAGLLFALAVWLPEAVTAQSLSGIGTFVEPAGVSQQLLVRLTADGEWAYWVEADWWNTCGPTPNTTRISRIRVDGTGYEVLVSSETLSTLAPSPFGLTFPEDFRISGDGRFMAFGWSPNDFDCKTYLPWRWFLVDVEAGTTSEFLHNGFVPYSVSFSDDGTRMAFEGWDPGTASYWWYLADPDGNNAVPLFDTSAWFTTHGIITPNGKQILFAGWGPPFAYVSDVYLYDIDSGTLQQVSPVSASAITALSCSDDLSRVVYASGGGPVYALNTDGSDFHVVSTEVDHGSATVTRNGRYILRWSLAAGLRDVRVDWDGSNPVVIDGTVNTTNGSSHRAVNWDGSLVAVAAATLGCPGWCPRPIAVWNERLPVLTTYGHGTTGSPLTWDVGGRPGDAFSLSLVPPRGPLVGVPAAHGLGEVGLDQVLGIELLSGVIDDRVNNTGSVQTIVPAVSSLIGALDIELGFRATVFDATGRKPPQVTNVTRMTLSLSDGSSLATAGHEHRHAAPRPPARVPTEDELIRRMLLRDPKVRRAVEQGLVDLPWYPVQRR